MPDALAFRMTVGARSDERVFITSSVWRSPSFPVQRVDKRRMQPGHVFAAGRAWASVCVELSSLDVAVSYQDVLGRAISISYRRVSFL